MKPYQRILLFLFIGNGWFLQPLPAQSISGTVNSYYHVTVINTPGNTVTVSNAAGLSPSVRVLIIQMKGATIDNSNTPVFGNVTAINNAGNYEFNTVCGVSGNNILLKYNLQKSYDVSGSVQMVTVPQYVSAVVIDSLKAAPWEPVAGTGGVLVIQASNSITLSAPVTASGDGFNGGSLTDFPQPPYNCDWATTIDNYFLANPPGGAYLTGGEKGEGIAASQSTFEAGKGKIANGGGGGNNHNSGGAGGGNYGAGGSGGFRSNEGGFNCHGQNPGIGGASLSSNGYGSVNNRIFLGGGGGTGHGNNNVQMTGANGGGIVIIISDTLYGNNNLIAANGFQPYRPGLADPLVAGGDGGGGGGGGGVVILSVNVFSGTVNVEAKGGRGSDASNAPSSGCFGPGGGGGGGVIWVKGSSVNSSITTNVSGGGNGFISNNTSVVACRGFANGAASGSNGSVVTNFVYSNGVFVCAPLDVNDLLFFKAKEYGNLIELQWQVRDQSLINEYEVERSIDQVNFSVINNVKNSGSNIYSCRDLPQDEELLYYRLKIHYKNSNIVYSSVIYIRLSGTVEWKLLQIFPNPSHNQFHIFIRSTHNLILHAKIVNTLGQLAMRQELALKKGLNKFSLDIGELSPGSYELFLNSGIAQRALHIVRQ